MFLRILDRLEELLITLLIAAATIIIFIAVMHRYLVGIPLLYPLLFPINLSWAQELCIIMFVWMAKFGAAYGVRTGIHVGVDVVVNQLSRPWRKGHGAVQPAVRRAVHRGGRHPWAPSSSTGCYHTDQVTPDMEIPSWIIYLCVPLGSYLMCFRFLQVARNFWRTGDLPHHDETQVEGIDIDAPGAGAAGITR